MAKKKVAVDDAANVDDGHASFTDVELHVLSLLDGNVRNIAELIEGSSAAPTNEVKTAVANLQARGVITCEAGFYALSKTEA